MRSIISSGRLRRRDEPCSTRGDARARSGGDDERWTCEHEERVRGSGWGLRRGQDAPRTPLRQAELYQETRRDEQRARGPRGAEPRRRALMNRSHSPRPQLPLRLARQHQLPSIPALARAILAESRRRSPRPRPTRPHLDLAHGYPATARSVRRMGCTVCCSRPHHQRSRARALHGELALFFLLPSPPHPLTCAFLARRTRSSTCRRRKHTVEATGSTGTRR